MPPRWLCFTLFTCLAGLATAETPLRIERLARCGDVLDFAHPRYCVRAHGLSTEPVQARLAGQVVNAERSADGLRLELQPGSQHSGPLLISQGSRLSNPVWLSLNNNHVLAAGPGEWVQNMDGLDTAVNLASLVLDAPEPALPVAQALAHKYGATVVGAIPALGTYQLRLPARDLTERDALLLRLGSEAQVNAVVVDERGPAAPAPALPGTAVGAPSVVAPANDDWAANRFADAVNFYHRRIAARGAPVETVPVKVAVIERGVDFDSPDFAEYLGDCQLPRTCVYAADAERADKHGSSVTGVLAAHWQKGGNTGLLRGLDGAGKGFEVIVDHDAAAGLLGSIAASVNAAEDGARVINWSWGLQRVGAAPGPDTQVYSGLAMRGYGALLARYFQWLQREHPQVVVVNAAGSGAAQSAARLPSALLSEQLLVVGAQPQGDAPAAPGSNGLRVDISAAACTQGLSNAAGEQGTVHCASAYAAPMVSGVLAAMLAINPALTPAQLRLLLRRSAQAYGDAADFVPADALSLTAPILPSERNYELNHPDVGRSARLDLQKALDLAVQSRDRRR
ncbi:S8 family serine peptidase [Pseudomonas sp. NPDC007930]|uniref:S8/S53 family peptidase n=1 Tax=Pseudomonas sp. NPDC007930 TaxID=3364417 RepID=UPI0036EDD280